jgi:hypothetical protein
MFCPSDTWSYGLLDKFGQHVPEVTSEHVLSWFRKQENKSKHFYSLIHFLSDL